MLEIQKNPCHIIRLMARKKSPEIEEEAQPELVGYARVSTPDQSLDLQLDLLRKAGVKEDFLFRDQMSAVAGRRRGWELCKKALRRGDTLIVYSLSRLGRDIRHLLDIERFLYTEGVMLRSLTEPIDTSTADGRLLFTVRAAFAQFEREVTRERTKDSVKKRKEAGLPVGRPGIPDKKKAAIRKDLMNIKLTLAMIAAKHGISIATVKYHFPRARVSYLQPDKT